MSRVAAFVAAGAARELVDLVTYFNLFTRIKVRVVPPPGSIPLTVPGFGSS
jgi:hypothetical protein